jgi:hypothetical protein
MGPLDIKDAVTVITGICTIAGVIFTLRFAVSKLESGQAELLRQLGALHKRMDHYGERINKAEVSHAVLQERVENMRPGPRDSQRFRLRPRQEQELELVAIPQDMFKPEDAE